MHVGQDGRWVVVKLQRGEEVLPSLQRALQDRGVSSGLVLSGIGALEDVELGWFNPEKGAYVRKRFGGSHELLSLQGSVTLGADPPVHVHATMSGPSYEALGGHLFEGRVSVLAEIGIQHLKGLPMTRAKNPATGLNELTMEPPSPATK
ncbi:MAG: PPC domain-containing DNA-binding protein [Thermoplasmata archaeon]|nr:PPC domain-containing DNA-binding protein [Thermoplasmata archaeon]